MSKKSFPLKRRIRSFGFAFRGIGKLIKEEHNAWIHCFCGALCYSGGILFRTFGNGVGSPSFLPSEALAAEAFNTAIEALCDFASPAHQEAIKHTKRSGCRSGTYCCHCSCRCGLLIFIPKLWHYVKTKNMEPGMPVCFAPVLLVRLPRGNPENIRTSGDVMAMDLPRWCLVYTGSERL